jgi:hypothetical protein
MRRQLRRIGGKGGGMNPGYLLYRFYYDDVLVYIGRTNRGLTERLRGHFFGKAHYRKIDIFCVSKIEYAEFKSKADMFLYEIYYINKFHPTLNIDDCADDELTICLPEAAWQVYDPPLMEKWKEKLQAVIKREVTERKAKHDYENEKREKRRTLSRDAYLEWLEEQEVLRSGNYYQYD